MKAVPVISLLLLSACVSPTIDYMAERADVLLDKTTEKLKEIKTETIQEVRSATEDGLEKMGATLDGTLNNFLNSDAIAFITVAVTGLLSLVVITGLYLLVIKAKKTN